MLQELQRLESRLQPFLQRYYEVLGAAATTDYNNNVSPPTPSPPAPPDRAGRNVDHFPCPVPHFSLASQSPSLTPHPTPLELAELLFFNLTQRGRTGKDKLPSPFPQHNPVPIMAKHQLLKTR